MEQVYKVTVKAVSGGWLVKIRNARTGATMAEWVKNESDVKPLIASVTGVI